MITNLLNNAAKYNDKPGHIVLTAERQGEEAVVRVLDDGIGIDKELLPRVFDLFTQADRSVARSQGGLGIGLTLVRSLVERHGGSVEVHSEGPGRGSEFVIRLPAAAAQPAAAERPQGDGHAPLGPARVQRRVLVVDDNIDAARAFAEIVSLWKHEVRVASNGAAALEMAKTYHPDIVLLDIGLPGMSGYQVAKQLRRQPEFAKTVLVAVTGYGQEEDRRRSREAGFNHHLVKPVAPDCALRSADPAQRGVNCSPTTIREKLMVGLAALDPPYCATVVSVILCGLGACTAAAGPPPRPPRK